MVWFEDNNSSEVLLCQRQREGKEKLTLMVQGVHFGEKLTLVMRRLERN